MMACGLPIIGITSNDDDLHNLIDLNDVGICVTDKRAETLMNAILQYYKNPMLLNKTSVRARKTVIDQYSRKRIQKEYEGIFSIIQEESDIR
jgi:glycosyltransferase involved in cell wall biosynthesis